MIENLHGRNYELAKAEADKVDEQIIEVLQAGHSFRVEAGAGSGKTYSLNKVIEWIQSNKWAEYSRKKQNVICITYTKQPGCGCFTQKGYYIQYQNGNVDSMLFVCESCYDEKFREKCSAGDFDEERYIVKDNAPRYQPINPLLRYLIRWTRKTAKTARIATILTALILVTAFGLIEHPSIRTEMRVPQLLTAK